MKTFKQFLEILDEAKHFVDPDEHERLINLHHSEVSKVNGHNNYEDRVGNAVKRTTLASHSPEVVKKVLDNFSQGSNTWVRRKAAEHPDLHHPDHKEILDRLLNDSSGKVRELAAAARKGAKETPAPKTEKPTPEAKKEAAPAVSIKKKPTPETKKEAPPVAAPAPKPEKSSGNKMEVVSGDSGDFPYASKVSHIMKGKKRLGTVVSGVRPSEMGNDEPFHHSYVTHKYPDGEEGLKSHDMSNKSHEHGLLGLVKHLQGK